MTALKWITNEARKLRKKYPKRFKEWRQYVAQASAIYARKHKGKSPVGKKKKVGKVRKVKRIAKRPAAKRATVNVKISGAQLTAAQHKARARLIIKERVGWLGAMQFTAKTKRAKHALGKKISELKSEYRRLS